MGKTKQNDMKYIKSKSVEGPDDLTKIYTLKLEEISKSKCCMIIDIIARWSLSISSFQTLILGAQKSWFEKGYYPHYWIHAVDDPRCGYGLLRMMS